MEGYNEKQTNRFEISPKNNFDSIPKLKMTNGEVSFATSEFMRYINEDRLYIDPENDSFGVVDGMGGYGDGDKAAECVVDSIIEGINKKLTAAEIHSLVLKKMRERGLLRAGACYIFCQLDKKRLKIRYAGDASMLVVNSRCEVTYRGIKRSLADAPRGNNYGNPNSDVVDVRSKDKIILASDGLWDNIIEAEALQIIKDLPIDVAVKKLSELAENGMTGVMSDGTRGNKDNLSIVLYEVLPAVIK